MSDTQVSSHQFSEMYADLGIDTGRLGCIMLDVAELKVSDIIAKGDLYFSENMDYVKGIVSEDVPHVTLLYGLMRSGPELKKHVDTVLEGGRALPTEVEIANVGYFDSTDPGGEPYYCLVAELVVTSKLLECNGRLSFLPHIDTFMAYRPHVTLAYIKKVDDKIRDAYIDSLNVRFAGAKVNVLALNYGD